MNSKQKLIAQWEPEKRLEYEAAVAQHGWPLPIKPRVVPGVLMAPQPYPDNSQKQR